MHPRCLFPLNLALLQSLPFHSFSLVTLMKFLSLCHSPHCFDFSSFAFIALDYFFYPHFPSFLWFLVLLLCCLALLLVCLAVWLNVLCVFLAGYCLSLSLLLLLSDFPISLFVVVFLECVCSCIAFSVFLCSCFICLTFFFHFFYWFL